MNRVTTRSPMRWTPTNARLNLILRMSTSKHASSYSAADRQMACLSRPVRRCHKTFIPKPTRLPELLDHLDLNGGLPLLNHLLQDLLLGQQAIGEDDLLRSTHHLSRRIHMTSGNLPVAPSLPHRVRQVQDKSSK